MSKISHTLTVLVVDDDKDLTTTQSWLLEAAGVSVLTANSADDCLKVVDVNCPDVILLDLGMPGTNGIELRRRLKVHPNCQGASFIAQTGYSGQDKMQKIKENGFDGYLVKPVHWSDLSAILDALKAGHTEVLAATFTDGDL